MYTNLKYFHEKKSILQEDFPVFFKSYFLLPMNRVRQDNEKELIDI